MKKDHERRCLSRHTRSKRALAIPLTYLILFGSLVAIISLTYSLAVAKISGRSALLKDSIAKQNMRSLDEAVHSVAWSFGASKTVYMDDCGGTFRVDRTAKTLVINFTDEQMFHDIVFNSPAGKTYYELETSEFNYDGLYIKGDYRAIINQSSLTMTQLYVASGYEAKELTLCYRPSATATTIGMSNGKPLNLVRIYLINLNSSQNLWLREKFYLKVSSLNITSSSHQYDFNESVSSLSLKTVFDGTTNIVKLPISSNAEGAAVTLEVVVCNVEIEKIEV